MDVWETLFGSSNKYYQSSEESCCSQQRLRALLCYRHTFASYAILTFMNFKEDKVAKFIKFSRELASLTRIASDCGNKQVNAQKKVRQDRKYNCINFSPTKTGNWKHVSSLTREPIYQCNEPWLFNPVPKYTDILRSRKCVLCHHVTRCINIVPLKTKLHQDAADATL